MEQIIFYCVTQIHTWIISEKTSLLEKKTRFHGNLIRSHFSLVVDFPDTRSPIFIALILQEK